MLGNNLLVEVLVEVFVRPVATFPKHLVALNDVFEPKGHVALASSVQDDLVLHSEFSVEEPAMDGWCSSFRQWSVSTEAINGFFVRVKHIGLILSELAHGLVARSVFSETRTIGLACQCQCLHFRPPDSPFGFLSN